MGSAKVPPNRVPSAIGSDNTELSHEIGVTFRPGTAGQFGATLDNMLVGGFDHALIGKFLSRASLELS